MAKMIATPVKGEFNEITEFAFEAATVATDGIEFTMPKITEEYVTILVHNTGSAAYDIAVKAPTKGSYAAASSDLVHELAAGEFAVIRIESARYANNDGTVLLVPENVAVEAVVLY